MKIKFMTLVLVTLYGVMVHADTDDLQNIELPNRSQVSWVASNITHNDQGMAIKAFSCECPIDDVLSFYRTAWKKPGDTPGYVENETGRWKIISRLSDSRNLVVQLKSSSSSATEGFISSMSLRPQPLREEGPFLVPSNAVEVSNTRTQDKGKTAHTTILVTPSSVGSTVGFYKDHLEREGWSTVSDDYVDGSYVLKFNKNMAAVEIVVNAATDGNTVVLLNRVQSGE